MLGSTTNCQHLTVIAVLYRLGKVIAMTSDESEGRGDAAGRGGIENLTLWQRVHEHLRQEILDNRLPPGSELLAGVMCAAPEGQGFSVSFHELRIAARD